MSSAARRWIVPDGWMPPAGDGPVLGHEAVCLVNLGPEDAEVRLTVLFEDAQPMVVDGLACGSMRTRHVRLDVAEEMQGRPLPTETPYALVVDASQPVYVQHTRVDTRAPALTLMTTMGIPADDALAADSSVASAALSEGTAQGLSS